MESYFCDIYETSFSYVHVPKYGFCRHLLPPTFFYLLLKLEILLTRSDTLQMGRSLNGQSDMKYTKLYYLFTIIPIYKQVIIFEIYRSESLKADPRKNEPHSWAVFLCPLR